MSTTVIENNTNLKKMNEPFFFSVKLTNGRKEKVKILLIKLEALFMPKNQCKM